MAEYGEWGRKGATLSTDTAQSEYGVARDFIIKGIKAEKLEWRESSIYGNPVLRILRSQLEAWIAAEHGADYVSEKKCQAELSKVKKEINDLNKTLKALLARKETLEAKLGVAAVPAPATKKRKV